MKTLIATAALIVATAIPAFADDSLACANSDHVRIGEACIEGTEAVFTWEVFGSRDRATAEDILAMSGTVLVTSDNVTCANFPESVLHLNRALPDVCMGEVLHNGPITQVNAPDGELWYRFEEVDPTTGALTPRLLKVDIPAQLPAGFTSVAPF